MQATGPRTVTLVLGGARSGKSRWAQELATKADRVAYVATALASDDQMCEKIRRHRQDRPQEWQTIEEPLELARVLADRAAEFDLLLVDCLTFYASNLLDAAASDPASMQPRIESFVDALRAAPASVVLVSNEVGSGVVPAFESGCRFRDALGELNQRVASIADNVVLMVAGLPLVIKGTIAANGRQVTR